MENNKLKLTDIDTTQKYDGYLWWSDKPSPEVYKNELLPKWVEHVNPYIIEGQLYDERNSKSWSIRFVDGNYLVHCFNLKALAGMEFIKKEYLPNRLNGITKLCFKEFWRPLNDEFCDDMPVLKPAETVFVGFNSKED